VSISIYRNIEISVFGKLRFFHAAVPEGRNVGRVTQENYATVPEGRKMLVNRGLDSVNQDFVPLGQVLDGAFTTTDISSLWDKRSQQLTSANDGTSFFPKQPKSTHLRQTSSELAPTKFALGRG
jgi:hypothetical protein